MSIAIEQDQQQARSAFELQSRADLYSIRLVQSRAVCNFAVEDVSFPLTFQLKHKAEHGIIHNAKLTVPIKFAFKALGTTNGEVVSITCRIEAVYGLSDGYEPTPEQIQAFKDGNAIFNCWAYFREFVHNTLTRMNYPPITLPFLRIVPKIVVPKDSTQTPKTIEGTAALIERSTREDEDPRPSTGEEDTKE